MGHVGIDPAWDFCPAPRPPRRPDGAVNLDASSQKFWEEIFWRHEFLVRGCYLRFVGVLVEAERAFGDEVDVCYGPVFFVQERVCEGRHALRWCDGREDDSGIGGFEKLFEVHFTAFVNTGTLRRIRYRIRFERQSFRIR